MRTESLFFSPVSPVRFTPWLGAYTNKFHSPSMRLFAHSKQPLEVSNDAL